jgi:hypothetical protein
VTRRFVQHPASDPSTGVDDWECYDEVCLWGPWRDGGTAFLYYSPSREQTQITEFGGGCPPLYGSLKSQTDELVYETVFRHVLKFGSKVEKQLLTGVQKHEAKRAAHEQRIEEADRKPLLRLATLIFTDKTTGKRYGFFNRVPRVVNEHEQRMMTATEVLRVIGTQHLYWRPNFVLSSLHLSEGMHLKDLKEAQETAKLPKDVEPLIPTIAKNIIHDPGSWIAYPYRIQKTCSRNDVAACFELGVFARRPVEWTESRLTPSVRSFTMRRARRIVANPWTRKSMEEFKQLAQ